MAKLARTLPVLQWLKQVTVVVAPTLIWARTNGSRLSRFAQLMLLQRFGWSRVRGNEYIIIVTVTQDAARSQLRCR